MGKRKRQPIMRCVHCGRSWTWDADRYCDECESYAVEETYGHPTHMHRFFEDEALTKELPMDHPKVRFSAMFNIATGERA